MSAVARFLFTVWPFTGHILPSLAIAHVLRERGHLVAFYTGARVSRFVDDEGFHRFPLRNVDEEEVFQLMFSRSHSPVRWVRLLEFRATLHDWLLGTVPGQVEDLEPVLAEWRPDVVVCDPTMWSPILVFHEKLDLPVAIASFMLGCMLPGPEVPPFGLGLPRPRSAYTGALAQLAARGMDLFAGRFRRTASELRGRHGLPPLTVSAIEFMGRMPLYLVPSTSELDYERTDLPPSVHYVGHCDWHGSRSTRLVSWLDDLRRDQPWVYVTEGTVRLGDPFLLRAAAQGLADMPLQVIMTTGGSRDPAELDLGRLAPNIHVVRFVPHDQLFPHTDLVISTGGGGTVLGALSAGVPQLIAPTEWDKPENAQRVAEAGAGLRQSPWRLTPKRLRTATEKILGEPSFRQCAQRIADSFARLGGASRAADLVEALSGHS